MFNRFRIAFLAAMLLAGAAVGFFLLRPNPQSDVPTVAPNAAPPVAPPPAGPIADSLIAAVQTALGDGMQAKLAVSEHYFSQMAWPADNATVGFTASDPSKAQVTITEGGIVTVEFAAPEELVGKTIVLSPAYTQAGEIEWACKATSDFPTAALPDHCR